MAKHSVRTGETTPVIKNKTGRNRPRSVSLNGGGQSGTMMTTMGNGGDR